MYPAAVRYAAPVASHSCTVVLYAATPGVTTHKRLTPHGCKK